MRFDRIVLGLVIVAPIQTAIAQGGPSRAPTQNVAVVNQPTVTINEKIYSALTQPVCDAGNRCYVYFPVVPEGQALRVSRVYGDFFTSALAGFVALRTAHHQSGLSENLVRFAVSSFPAFFEGNALSFNQDTNIIVVAGQQPVLVLGTPAAGDIIGTDARNRMGITGTLIDAP